MAVNKDQNLLGELESALKQKFRDKLNITKSKPYYLEVSNRKANKGDALKVIADPL